MPATYAAFERVMEAAVEAVPLRILAYCLISSQSRDMWNATHCGRTW
jgi:hypothetical protein